MVEAISLSQETSTVKKASDITVASEATSYSCLEVAIVTCTIKRSIAVLTYDTWATA